MTQGSLSDAGDEVVERAPLLEPGLLVAKRYRLTRLLGAGTSGTVYEAEHTLLTSRVAIKFLDGVLASHPERAEIMLERFRFEAQVSARLAPITKHIVAAQDAGLHDGIPYLVMELAPGDSLESKLASGPLTPEEAIEMITQIADALDAAHAAGIAHRDVKPANLLCVGSKSGEPTLYKLADFGVAKLIGAGLAGISPPKATAENTLVGSPAYMSPEYVSGTVVIDGRLDLWALAVVAYEALTLSIPFDGEVWTQVAVSIVQGVYKPVTERDPSLPAGLDAFFARAFAQNAEARFSTARELAVAFVLAIRGGADGSVGADEPTAGPMLVNGTPPKRRSGFVPILIGLTALLVLAFMGVLFLGEASAPAAPTGTVNLAATETASPTTAHLQAPPLDTASLVTAEPTASAEVAVASSATPTTTAKAASNPVKIRMKPHVSKSEIP